MKHSEIIVSQQKYSFEKLIKSELFKENIFYEVQIIQILKTYILDFKVIWLYLKYMSGMTYMVTLKKVEVKEIHFLTTDSGS